MTLGSPSSLGHGFGFFKDADSHVAPPSDLGTAVGAGDKTVICRMVWDDESIAATLTVPEGELCVSAWVGSGMALRPFS